MRFQSYPYFTTPQLQNPQYGHGQNCFVLGQVFQRNLPTRGKIGFSRNLAEPSQAGTFILDRRLGLEKTILPQLQELCLATNLILLPPKNSGVDRQQYQVQLGASGKLISADDDKKGLADSLAWNRATDQRGKGLVVRRSSASP